MSMMILAAMMMGQVAAPPQSPVMQQPTAAQQPATKKQKPKQVCETIEVTGSRSKRRVCHDEGGNVDLAAYGVSGSVAGKGHSDTTNGSVPNTQ
jgi:hypothetical protein